MPGLVWLCKFNSVNERRQPGAFAVAYLANISATKEKEDVS